MSRGDGEYVVDDKAILDDYREALASATSRFSNARHFGDYFEVETFFVPRKPSEIKRVDLIEIGTKAAAFARAHSLRPTSVTMRSVSARTLVVILSTGDLLPTESTAIAKYAAFRREDVQ